MGGQSQIRQSRYQPARKADAAINIIAILAVLLIGQTVTDPGFEQPAQGQGRFSYAPTGSAWTFGPQAGLSGNATGFTGGNPAAPQGAQVAFLQGRPSISQAVPGWKAGSYQLTFQAAQRANLVSRQDFQIMVDDVVIGTFLPDSTVYGLYITPAFDVGEGAHKVTFQGINSTNTETGVYR
jgi:hypothetical protein